MGGPDFKLCKFICPSICSVTAIITANTFAFWCRSFKFQSNALDLPDNFPLIGDQLQLRDMHFGPWYQLQTEVQEIGISEDGITVYTWDNCVEWIDDSGRDTTWQFVRAATVITPIFGVVFTCFICCTPCLDEVVAKMWKGMAMCFLIVVTLFQGLTFLIFRSNACDANRVVGNVGNDLRNLTNSSFVFYDDECEWDEGSSSNVVAVVCYFLTGLIMLAMGVPKSSDDGEDEAPPAKEDPAAEEGGDKPEEQAEEAPVEDADKEEGDNAAEEGVEES